MTAGQRVVINNRIHGRGWTPSTRRPAGFSMGETMRARHCAGWYCTPRLRCCLARLVWARHPSSRPGSFPSSRKDRILPVYLRLDVRERRGPLIDQIKLALQIPRIRKSTSTLPPSTATSPYGSASIAMGWNYGASRTNPSFPCSSSTSSRRYSPWGRTFPGHCPAADRSRRSDRESRARLPGFAYSGWGSCRGRPLPGQPALQGAD